MIVFDLRCTQSHIFEAWFGSTAAFEDQRARGLLACPICGDADIDKAVMAPRVGTKGNASTPAPSETTNPNALQPEALKAAMQALAAAQAQMLEKSEWVGRSFAGRARAMHAGDEAAAPIHGQTTIAEAKALADEGVPCAPLPLPIVPPKALN